MNNCYEYLKRLPPIALDRLYRCPWSCRAVFQSLSPLAQQYAMRLLCVTAPLPRATLEEWVTPKYASNHRAAVSQLLGMRFLLDDGSGGGGGGVDLTGDGDGDATADLFGEDGSDDDGDAGEGGASGGGGSSWRAGAPRGPRGGGGDVRLNPAVAATLMDALSATASAPWSSAAEDGGVGGGGGGGGGAREDDKHPLTASALASWARMRWERLLYHMVDATYAAPRDSPEERGRMQRVVSLLHRSGLMVARDEASAGAGGEGEAGGGGGAYTLSPKGFEFMLCDQPTQLWLFLREYLDAGDTGDGAAAAAGAGAGAAPSLLLLQQRRLPADRVLQMLFRLAHCRLGEGVGMGALAEGERALLSELSDVGLLYVKEQAGLFYATPLAALLVFGSGQGAGGGGAGGGGGSGEAGGAAGGEQLDGADGGTAGGLALSLIVETNFKLYAFTASLLDARLLSYFVEVQYRLPDMCMGEITRDSAHDAYRAGITAQQIITFLDNHAHPHAQGRSPVTPENVKEQLQLWEAENNRFVPKAGVLYHKFAGEEEFDEFRNYAKDLHVLLWSSAKSRKMCVTERGHEQMRLFSREKKKRKLAAAGMH